MDREELELQLQLARCMLDDAVKDASIYKIARFQESVSYLEKELEKLKKKEKTN